MDVTEALQLEPDENRLEKVAELIQILSGLTDTNNFPKLERRELGEDSFSGSLTYIAQIVMISTQLLECDLKRLPSTVIEELHSYARQAMELFREIFKFTIKDEPNRVKENRNNLISRVESVLSTFQNRPIQIISYNALQKDRLNDLELSAKTALLEIESGKTKSLQEMTDYKQQAGELLEAMRKTAQKEVISAQAQTFHLEAKKQRTWAWVWLAVFGVVAIVGAIFGFKVLEYSVSHIDEFAKLTTGQSIQLGLPKLFIVSIYVSALVLVGKLHRAAQHNYTVNQHRVNALNTFETFRGSTSDPETQKAILLASANCIFSTQPSGYVTQDAEPDAFGSIAGIARALSGKS